MVDRSFLLPSDQQLELELWADTAEFDTTELHEVQTTSHVTKYLCFISRILYT